MRTLPPLRRKSGGFSCASAVSSTGLPLAHHEIPAETDAQTDEQSAARQTQGAQGAQDAQGAQGVVVSIRLMRQLRAKGSSLRRIAEELQAKGFTNRAGKRLSPQLIANVLRRS